MILQRFRLRRALLAILGTVVMPILFNLLSTDLQSAWDQALVGTARKVVAIRQHPTKYGSEVERDIVIATVNDQSPGASDRVLQSAIT
jgi:hypothetical protein